MSHNWIFINSSGYRRFIERSKESRLVFWGATAGLLGAACVAGDFAMRLTTHPDMQGDDSASGGEGPAAARPEQLAKMPLHAQLVARTNRQHLRAMIDDVRTGKDDDRYKAMLE